MEKILKESRLCAGMSDEQIDRLIALGNPKYINYQKNDMLFLETLNTQTIQIMVKGSMAIAKDMPDGKRILGTEITMSGELIGDVNLFATLTAFWDYLVAMTDSVVLHIYLQPFLYKNTEHSDIQAILYKNLLTAISNKLVYTNEKLRIVSQLTVRKKILCFLLGQLKENGEIHLNMTREELADYLGIQRPSLSRELSKMQKEGLLRVDHRTILIQNKEIFNVLNE